MEWITDVPLLVVECSLLDQQLMLYSLSVMGCSSLACLDKSMKRG